LRNPKDQLRLFLEQQVQIEEKDWNIILPYLEILEIEKDQILTQAGIIESNLYFVSSGITRLFYEKEERDITINFGFPNGFISSYSSFLTQELSQFILQSLTRTTLISISKDHLDSIYAQTACGHHLGRLFSEQFFIYVSKRETDFMLRSPTERYLLLFDEYPQLIKEIPLKYLASYIGITPQALSRIRAKIS